jgi:dTMP kinase
MFCNLKDAHILFLIETIRRVVQFCMSKTPSKRTQRFRRQSLKHSGCLIAFEGIDGVGKSTQARLLVEKLNRQGFHCVLLKEPTAGKWGQKISSMSKFGRTVSVEEEFRLFFEDRKEDVRKRISPSLRAGQVVIMDRYFYSNIAYQGAEGLDVEFIERENLKIAPKPEIVIILDLDVEKAHDRIVNMRKEMPNHFEQRLSPVRQKFLEMAATHKEITILDSNRPVEETLSKILSIVIPKLRDLSDRKVVKYDCRKSTEIFV